ncbi:MAG: AAA family ATPase [Phycisphaerales bacterium]|nr:MAG: AAA family ATPase [Phycisphaerales bacterium]
MTTDGTVCSAIMRRLSRLIGEDKQRKYIEGATKVSYDQRRLRVAASSTFAADLIARRFASAFEQAVREETGDEGAGVDIAVDPGAFDDQATEAATINERATQAAAANAVTTRPKGRQRRPGMRLRSLDDFLVGPSNSLAWNAAMAVATGRGGGGVSPLFVHGGCGLGKTHLLQGIIDRARRERPGVRVRYTTGEAFTNGFIASLRSGRIDEFRRAFRDIDVLCIDDVHFLARKGATQSEFLHTFDAIELSGARVVLASDEHPRQIRMMSEKLISRFMAGMVVAIDPPDDALRERIVAALFERRGLRVEAAAARLIADRFVESVRDLEGAVARVDAMHRLVEQSDAPSHGAHIGLPVGVIAVERALGVARRYVSKPVSVARIAQVVCDELRVDPSEMLGRSRHKRVVFARALTAHLSRVMTTLSYPEIARAMNRPNHSTIITACNRVVSQIERAERCDPSLINDPPHAGAAYPHTTPTVQEFVDRLRRQAGLPETA